jgi:hypothetical protein
MYLFADGLDLLLRFEWVVWFVLEQISDDFFYFFGDEGCPVGKDSFVGFAVHNYQGNNYWLNSYISTQFQMR